MEIIVLPEYVVWDEHVGHQPLSIWTSLQDWELRSHFIAVQSEPDLVRVWADGDYLGGGASDGRQ